MEDDRNRWKQRGEGFRRQAEALAIPTLFLGAPIGTGFFGWWLGGMAGYPKTGFLVGAALGMAAAIRESARILKRLSKD